MEDIEIAMKEIGKGTFSSVYKARYKGHSDLYALKRINIQSSVYKEEKIHLTLYHENIIRLYRYFTFDDALFLLMEFADGGNLREEITNNKRLHPDVVKNYSKQILRSISYCNNNYVIHRDVKSENFLIVKGNIKLCDFGLSILLENINEKCYDYIGTVDFMAPELAKLDNEIGYGVEVDIWATGVVIYEMLIGKTTFYDNRIENTIEKIITVKYNLPSEFQEWENFFSQIFQIDPSKRATADYLISKM